MFYVKTVSFSILVNSSPFGNWKATRGLKQGDPLSPYLFILCVQVFSATLEHHVRIGMPKGIKISLQAPKIVHIMYTDDTLLFSTLTIHKVQLIKHNLLKYEQQSGKKVNVQKLQFIHHKKLHLWLSRLVFQILHVLCTLKFPVYLGMPFVMGRASLRLLTNLSSIFMLNFQARKLRSHLMLANRCQWIW